MAHHPQVLREAKDGAEQKAKENEEFEEARKAHFGAQFDEFQGMFSAVVFSWLIWDVCFQRLPLMVQSGYDGKMSLWATTHIAAHKYAM